LPFGVVSCKSILRLGNLFRDLGSGGAEEEGGGGEKEGERRLLLLTGLSFN
jgi:hypothetical protein